jgi:HPt (histidine-containing phosphotransfer) domain-containing protein
VNIGELARILGESDRAVLTEILQRFAVTARESHAEVIDLVLSGDASRLRRAAHGAKGESRNAATSLLGNLYAALEAKAKTGESTTALVAEIGAEVARVEAFVAAYAAGQP